MTPTTRGRAPTFTGAAYVARLASICTAAISSMHEASSTSSARTRAPAYHLHTAVRVGASCFLEVHGSGFRRGDRGATRAHAATVIVSYQVLSRGTVSDTVRRR